jgi:hypothetical protein
MEGLMESWLVQPPRQNSSAIGVLLLGDIERKSGGHARENPQARISAVRARGLLVKPAPPAQSRRQNLLRRSADRAD